MLNIEEIRSFVRREGVKIEAPPSLLSVPSKSIGDGSPHVEVYENHYDYVVSERGLEITRKSTSDEDELLFWIFSDIAANLSQKSCSASRIDLGVDPRRCLFQERLKILGKVDSKWAERERENIDEILELNPLDDYVNIRSEYCKSLISQGLNHQKAYEEALERYPVGTSLDSENIQCKDRGGSRF